MAGEAKKNMRPAGETNMPADASAKTPEGDAIGTDRAAVAEEQRAEMRDKRKRGDAPSMHGGTPK